MQLFGIIGHPLSHTMSPFLHNWGFCELGIPASYHAWEIIPEKLPAFMAALRLLPIHGASVTIPHKEAVMSMVDHLTDSADKIGAVNTLYRRDGQLWGDNTDVIGFMAPINAMSPGKALILGAGGAARAAVYGLTQAGWSVSITARTESRAKSLAQAFSCPHLSWEDRYQARPALLVNTTPLGMAGKFQHMTPWDAPLTGIRMVYDLVYNPQQTLLLKQAEDEGVGAIFGLSMFAHQGLAQFELWTGRRFNLDNALDLLQQVLRQRNRP